MSTSTERFAEEFAATMRLIDRAKRMLKDEGYAHRQTLTQSEVVSLMSNFAAEQAKPSARRTLAAMAKADAARALAAAGSRMRGGA